MCSLPLIVVTNYCELGSLKQKHAFALTVWRLVIWHQFHGPTLTPESLGKNGVLAFSDFLQIPVLVFCSSWSLQSWVACVVTLPPSV